MSTLEDLDRLRADVLAAMKRYNDAQVAQLAADGGTPAEVAYTQFVFDRFLELFQGPDAERNAAAGIGAHRA